MSCVREIGKVSGVDWKFEWTINNFFASTKKKTIYRSPDFNACDTVWYLKIFQGRKVNEEECVSLFLFGECTEKVMAIRFELGIKTVNNTTVNVHESNWKPNGEDDWGWIGFIKRSDLESRKSEMMPSENLTVTCSIRMINNARNSDESKNKLAADLMNLLVSKENTDVTIKVQEETFSAHRLILAARSPVLAAMFENEMIEKKTGFINISDCDPEVFSQFLQFLYSAEVDYGKCNMFRLYEIADKYDVADLKVVCANDMIITLSVENFCEVYSFAHQFNDNMLLTNLQKFFNGNFEEIVSSDSLLSLMEADCSLANNLLKAMAPIVNKIDS